MATDQSNDHIRYEPDEPCPLFVSVTAGFQGVLLVLTPIVTTVTTTAHVAALEGQNLQDQLSYLNEEESQEHEVSFRLLRHYAESVRHQKYYGVDVVKVLVAERSMRASRLD